MADLGIIFLRRKHTIHWYQSLFTIITGSMPFRYFWATLYRAIYTGLEKLRHFGVSCLATTPNSLETLPQFFWNVAMFWAKLASVNANRRNVAIFHHVTFATAGLLHVHALFEIVYDTQHNVCTTTCTRTHTHTHTHIHTHTHTYIHTRTHTHTHVHTHTHMVVSTPIEDYYIWLTKRGRSGRAY